VEIRLFITIFGEKNMKLLKNSMKLLMVSILSATMYGSAVAGMPAGFPDMTAEQKAAFGSMMGQMSPQETQLMQEMMKTVSTEQKQMMLDMMKSMTLKQMQDMQEMMSKLSADQMVMMRDMMVSVTPDQLGAMQTMTIAHLELMQNITPEQAKEMMK
jgi:hypothetical protein